MADPTSSDAHTDSTSSAKHGFTCSSCSKGMKDWKSGSKCDGCKAADKPDSAFVKAGAGAGKPKAKAASGNVQDEFPRCPSCGQPSADGTRCDDCKMSVEREHRTGDLTVAQMETQMRQEEIEAQEEDDRRKIRGSARQRMARMLGLDVAKAARKLEDAPPSVLKASTAERFSFAPMYMPGKLDAHGEFVASADDLQKAAWSYVRKSGADRKVYLQHIDQPAGEWVEITSWPYAVDAPMTMPGTGEVRKATFPAGTVYMGVVWEPWAWEMVQKGRLLGFSMGGWAKRVQAELADETVTKAAGAGGASGEPWTRAGIVNPQSPALSERLPFDEDKARAALGLPPFALGLPPFG